MPKNKQSNLIARVKTPNIGFINIYIYIYYKLRNEGREGLFSAEMETGRVAGRVEILRPAGQAG